MLELTANLLNTRVKLLYGLGYNPPGGCAGTRNFEVIPLYPYTQIDLSIERLDDVKISE